MKCASWERSSFGNILHIWLSENSHADISIPCETFKQARVIAGTYNITSVNKQSR